MYTSITAGIVITITIIIITQMKKITANANAKINLFLDVLKKRNDGYHEIRTIFLEIALHDIVTFDLTKNSDIKILSNLEHLNGSNNLVFQVASYIKEKYRVKNGVSVFVEKRIPVGAGLGGGSSNAALAIKSLNILWDLDLSIEEQSDIASYFGSDINFFLWGKTAMGKGRGEIITPMKPVSIDNILLVNPRYEISSSEAYSLLSLSEQCSDWELLIATGNVDYCYNKLQENLVEKYPDLANLLDKLTSMGAKKSMISGSGPTVVGFFEDKNQVKAAEAEFRKIGLWTNVTSSN
ncbi:MAG: 4-(cytidine 5'-diphospho)-2-C-methyl-D-erythritol kinase [Candidatus Cloacimonetes bacterium]|nr:4-(cytidine 5'-diphospho)-2-C-methyl-D-erythritol kinase [Candidatus Cloacimonadota bacterium]